MSSHESYFYCSTGFLSFYYYVQLFSFIATEYLNLLCQKQREQQMNWVFFCLARIKEKIHSLVSYLLENP